MAQRYNFNDFPPSFLMMLRAIDAPISLPKLDVFVAHLKSIIDIQEKAETDDWNYLNSLVDDINSLDVNRLRLHSEFKTKEIYKQSPFYYLLIQIDELQFNGCLKHCCFIFFDQLLRSNTNKNVEYHFELTNQNIVRYILSSKNKIPGTEFNIFNIYQQIDKRIIEDKKNAVDKSHIDYLLVALNNLKTNQNYKDKIAIFKNLITCFQTKSTSGYIKPFSKPKKTLTPTEFHQKHQEKTDGVIAIEFNTLDDIDKEPIKYDFLEVVTNDKSKITSIGELAKWSRTRLSLKNHYPQIHNHVLNNKEALSLYDFLLKDYVEESEGIARFSVLLMLLLGLDSTWLKYIKIVQVLPENIEPYHIYISTKGVFRFNLLPIKSPFHRDESQKLWLKGTHAKSLTFGLPIILIDQLNLHFNAKLGSDENIKNINKLFEKIRYHLGKRFTQARVREFSFNLYYRASQDEAIASFLQPIHTNSIPTGCYYTSLPVTKAYRYHQQEFSALFDELATITEIDENSYIGSEMNIDILAIKSWLNDLIAKVDSLKIKTRSLDDLIAYHNLYVKYVATILLITTGHRLVNDIFDNRNFIFIENGVCFIGDKASSKENSLRIVPLCSVAIKQIQLYCQHLESISFRISKFDSVLGQKIVYTSTVQNNHFCPFLFEIINKNKMLGIGGKCLKEFWGNNFPLPINFNRHLLSTQLSNFGLCREYINYLLGHLAAGQNPLASTSPLNVNVWKQPILNALEKMSKSLNLIALKGLKKGKNHQQLLVSELKVERLDYGVVSRQAKRRKKELKVRSRVAEFFKLEFPNLINFKLYSKLSATDIDKIKHYNDSLPSDEKTKGYEASQKIISRYYRKFNKKPPVIWFIEKNDSSGIFPLSVPANLQKARLISTIIENLVIDSFSTTKQTFTEKLALSYIYAITENLSSKTTISNYLNLLKQNLQIVNQSVFLENKINNYLVNWFPNTLMLLMIYDLKNHWPKLSPTIRNISKKVNELLTQIASSAGLDNLSVDTINKLFKYSFIFNSSPAEDHQKRAVKLYSRIDTHHTKPQQEKEEREHKRNIIFSPENGSREVNTADIFNFYQELKSLGNTIRNKLRLEQRSELVSILKKYSKSNHELTYVLSHWGLHMLSNGTRKTSTPAVSTIVTYLTVNMLALNELILDEKLLKMTGFELSSILDEVLETNGINKHILSSLLNFIDFLDDAANKPDIIISKSNWDADSVDVNYFSADEIKLILKSDWKDEELLFIELLFYTGCRISEAYGLLCEDIDTIGQSIQFRTNILSKQKNEFSIRPFPFDLLPVQLIEKLKKKKNSSKSKSPIFDISANNMEQNNYKVFCLSLNKKLYGLLKRNIGLKHFRHTYARSNFINNENKSLRSIWQESTLLGHSSPAMSQQHYIHDVFQKNKCFPIEDKLLEKVLGIKTATIRKQRERHFKGITVSKANREIQLKIMISLLN